MENCKHEIDVKLVNGVMVSYCKKCGKILNQQTSANSQINVSCESISSSLKDNGGMILHD